MSFIGVTYRNMDEALLIPHEKRWLKDSYLTKAHPSMGDSSPKLGTCNTFLPRRQLSGFSFQVTHLTQTSCSQLGWFLLFIVYSGRKWIWSFWGDFLNLFELFTFWLKELPCRMKPFQSGRKSLPNILHHRAKGYCQNINCYSQIWKCGHVTKRQRGRMNKEGPCTN